jgi:hypothetical protein
MCGFSMNSLGMTHVAHAGRNTSLVNGDILEAHHALGDRSGFCRITQQCLVNSCFMVLVLYSLLA